MIYNVNNWYWSVGGSTTHVYSSNRIAYVSTTDTTYQSWLSSDNKVTNISNSSDLYGVVLQQWAPNYLSAGVSVQSTGSPELNSIYPLDQQSQFNLTGISTGIASGKGLPGGGSTFIYNGNEFTSNQFLSLATALETYVYNFNIALAMIIQTGSGSLPTTPLIIA